MDIVLKDGHKNIQNIIQSWVFGTCTSPVTIPPNCIVRKLKEGKPSVEYTYYYGFAMEEHISSLQSHGKRPAPGRRFFFKKPKRLATHRSVLGPISPFLLHPTPSIGDLIVGAVKEEHRPGKHHVQYEYQWWVPVSRSLMEFVRVIQQGLPCGLVPLRPLLQIPNPAMADALWFIVCMLYNEDAFTLAEDAKQEEPQLGQDLDQFVEACAMYFSDSGFLQFLSEEAYQRYEQEQRVCCVPPPPSNPMFAPLKETMSRMYENRAFIPYSPPPFVPHSHTTTPPFIPRSPTFIPRSPTTPPCVPRSPIEDLRQLIQFSRESPTTTPPFIPRSPTPPFIPRSPTPPFIPRSPTPTKEAEEKTSPPELFVEDVPPGFTSRTFSIPETPVRSKFVPPPSFHPQFTSTVPMYPPLFQLSSSKEDIPFPSR